MRILGVDYGRRRTGIALSDPLGLTCGPLIVLEERDITRLVDAVMSEARRYEVVSIVVGLPRPLSGGTNEQMEDVLRFVDLLAEHSEIPVDTWDERFTTSLAEKGSRRSAPMDAVAACYMLQNYLDRASAREGR